MGVGYISSTEKSSSICREVCREGDKSMQEVFHLKVVYVIHLGIMKEFSGGCEVLTSNSSG